MFEKGKWYKDGDTFVKYYEKDKITSFYSSEEIHKGIYSNFKTLRMISGKNWKEISLEEIQEFLPDNHPDKIQNNSEFKVGDWVIASIGEIQYIVKLTKLNPPLGLFRTLKSTGRLISGGSFEKIIRKAKLEEIPVKDLSNEEILEVCKQYYPVGTKFKTAHMPEKKSYVKHSNYFWGNNNIYCASEKHADDYSKHKYNGCLYKNGKFAEIISTSDYTTENFEVKLFPDEGCVYDNVSKLEFLAKYLLNRPYNKADGKTTKSEAIGIGWNKHSFWWLKTTNSGKTVYKLNDLKEFLPMEVKDDFVLPDKWFIIRNKENYEILNKWENDTHYNGNNAAYLSTLAYIFSDRIYSNSQDVTKGYIEISTEQFKKYVLGENLIVGTKGNDMDIDIKVFENPEEIYIPTITKPKNKIDYTINSVFADIKVNLPEKPKKVVKPIVLEKFNLII